MGIQIYVVAACHEQVDVNTSEAKDLYRSEVFKACKAYVEEQQKEWLILSDFHGLVWPTTKLSPYDPRLFSDEERISRIERALEPDVIAYTLISTLGLQPDGRKPLAQWKQDTLRNTEFILLGKSESLSLAMTELSLAGIHVFCPFLGLKEQEVLERVQSIRKHKGGCGITSSGFNEILN